MAKPKKVKKKKYISLVRVGGQWSADILLAGVESSITFLMGSLGRSIKISTIHAFLSNNNTSPIRLFPAGNLMRFIKPEHCCEAMGVHCFVVCDNEKEEAI